MAGVQPPPFRSLDDFLLSSARFAVPDVRDLDRWNNRIINNLLYYQSNYLLFALGCLLLVGYFQPFQLFVGAVVVTLLFLGFVWAAENQAPIRRFRRNHPSVCVLVILVASYLFISVLGGVAVFLFGIAFPILMVLVHASVRLRSLKNKLENKLESIGLKRTPMGLLLEALGQEQEAGS
ncbi:PRA1 family protein 2 [Mastacembelus armatus]|uniref:PRA1 family protein n=1 Tax=Mastacembelus armatus TaxID=205130 RepID=A0A3Q3KXT2_9TELE|nr:PRA1 family protein 3-like [Mastacembelus armatus]